MLDEYHDNEHETLDNRATAYTYLVICQPMTVNLTKYSGKSWTCTCFLGVLGQVHIFDKLRRSFVLGVEEFIHGTGQPEHVLWLDSVLPTCTQSNCISVTT